MWPKEQVFLGPLEKALPGPLEQVFRGPQEPALPEPLEKALPEQKVQALVWPKEQVFPWRQELVSPGPLELMFPWRQELVFLGPLELVSQGPQEPLVLPEPLEPLEPDLHSPSSGSECEVRHDGWPPCPLACDSKRQAPPHRSRSPPAVLRPRPCRSGR